MNKIETRLIEYPPIHCIDESQETVCMGFYSDMLLTQSPYYHSHFYSFRHVSNFENIFGPGALKLTVV